MGHFQLEKLRVQSAIIRKEIRPFPTNNSTLKQIFMFPEYFFHTDFKAVQTLSVGY